MYEKGVVYWVLDHLASYEYGLEPGTRWALASRAKMIFVPRNVELGARIVDMKVCHVFNYLAYDPSIGEFMPNVTTVEEADMVNAGGGYNYLWALADSAVKSGCQECWYRADNHISGLKQHCVNKVRPDIYWGCEYFAMDEDQLVDKLVEE